MVAPNVRAALLSSGAFNPLSLGSKLVFWLDAEFLPSLDLTSGSLVNSWSMRVGQGTFAQSFSSQKPSWDPTGLQIPSLNFDGTDDCLLQSGIGNLPIGSPMDLEIFAIERNSLNAGTTAGQILIAWGATSPSNQIRITRTASGGIARRSMVSRGGSASTSALISGVPVNTRILTRGRVSANEVSIAYNREAEVTAAVASNVNSAFSSAVGSANGGAANYWSGRINSIMGATRLTDAERLALTEWHLRRAII